MLKTKLIHPEIMAALSLCGHGSKVLIAGAYGLTIENRITFKDKETEEIFR